ncbi:MADS-box transcription factor [Pseudohyphozyma bogoriensis]|nr:MADS-box transcription factor [Pseudohyphozyma bogoriensis]
MFVSPTASTSRAQLPQLTNVSTFISAPEQRQLDAIPASPSHPRSRPASANSNPRFHSMSGQKRTRGELSPEELEELLSGGGGGEDFDDDDDDEGDEGADESAGGAPPGKKAKNSKKRNATSTGRRKINIRFIDDKSKRHVSFTKRKAGLMKKGFELSTLTGTECLILVVSETGLVYTYATPNLKPIVELPRGKEFIGQALKGELRAEWEESKTGTATEKDGGGTRGENSPSAGVSLNGSVGAGTSAGLGAGGGEYNGIPVLPPSDVDLGAGMGVGGDIGVGSGSQDDDWDIDVDAEVPVGGLMLPPLHHDDYSVSPSPLLHSQPHSLTHSLSQPTHDAHHHTHPHATYLDPMLDPSLPFPYPLFTAPTSTLPIGLPPFSAPATSTNFFDSLPPAVHPAPAQPVASTSTADPLAPHAGASTTPTHSSPHLGPTHVPTAYEIASANHAAAFAAYHSTSDIGVLHNPIRVPPSQSSASGMGAGNGGRKEWNLEDFRSAYGGALGDGGSASSISARGGPAGGAGGDVEERRGAWRVKARESMARASELRTIPSALLAHLIDGYSRQPIPPPLPPAAFDMEHWPKPEVEGKSKEATWCAFWMWCDDVGVVRLDDLEVAVAGFVGSDPDPKAQQEKRTHLIFLFDWLEGVELISSREAERLSSFNFPIPELGGEEKRTREAQEVLRRLVATSGGGGGEEVRGWFEVYKVRSRFLLLRDKELEGDPTHNATLVPFKIRLSEDETRKFKIEDVMRGSLRRCETDGGKSWVLAGVSEFHPTPDPAAIESDIDPTRMVSSGWATPKTTLSDVAPLPLTIVPLQPVVGSSAAGLRESAKTAEPGWSEAKAALRMIAEVYKVKKAAEMQREASGDAVDKERAKVKYLEDKLTQECARSEQLENENLVLETRIEDASRKFTDIENKFHGDIGKLEIALSAEKEKVERLTESSRNATEQTADLSNQLASLQRTPDLGQPSPAPNDTQLSEIQATLFDSDRRNDTLEKEVASLSTELKVALGERQKLEARVEEVETALVERHQESKVKIEDLERELEKYKETRLNGLHRSRSRATSVSSNDTVTSSFTIVHVTESRHALRILQETVQRQTAEMAHLRDANTDLLVQLAGCS